MTEIGSVIDGKYEVLKQIGQGGMSVVYLAMDNRLNKQWAIKEIKKFGKGKNDEIVVNSLLAEANLMKQLDHPALPRIVDIIDNGQTIYVIMDYIEGESLDKILAMEGPQPEEKVIDWAKQLCDALSYLHSQNPPIIYRDMKPANVMLKPEGNLKLIDFGIAREYKENSLSDTDVLGTRGYAPPEQHGSRQTDARSDIYALGMTMHHLLTGIDPRPADYVYRSIREINPNLNDGIEFIIDKCTALEPEDRYQNCSELMYDLEHYQLITKDYKKSQKRKLAACITGAGVCLLSLLLGFIFMFISHYQKSNNYDAYLAFAGSRDEKIAAYEEAIKLQPNSLEPYIKVIDACISDGDLDDTEVEILTYKWNQAKRNLGKKVSSPEFLDYTYKMGYTILLYYGNKNMTDAVNYAYSCFEYNNNQNVDFENKDISNYLYNICSYNKKFNNTVDGATRSDVIKMFGEINSEINNISGTNEVTKLIFYRAVCKVLFHNDNIVKMASLQVPLKDILDIFDNIVEKANSINTTGNEYTTELKKEINDLNSCRNSIITTYENASKDRG